MIADIRRLLEDSPFQPFSIVTSCGVKYRVASRDHANFDPNNKHVIIWFDDSSHVTITGLHIVAIEEEFSAASQPI